MSFFFRKKQKTLPANATFRLTQEGREKLQNYSGDSKSQVFMALETQGTLDTGEIANYSGLSKGQVERLMPQLVRSGYVQIVSAAMEE